MDTHNIEPASASRLTLGMFLKSMRRRIDRDSQTLGTFERPASRQGRAVTQEEIAEATGSSRVWYAMLESDATLRSSPRLLDRIADVLMLAPDERTMLFSLAIPEFKRPDLTGRAAALSVNCSAIRSAVKELWAASSESEALDVAAKHLAGPFEDVRSIRSSRRIEAGLWELRPVVEPRRGAPFSVALQDLRRSLPPEELDALLLFPQVAEPGVVGTESHYNRRMRQQLDDAMNRNGVVAIRSFIVGRVHSRQGLVASLVATYESRHHYSEAERAAISTLAELTSLALS